MKKKILCLMLLLHPLLGQTIAEKKESFGSGGADHYANEMRDDLKLINETLEEKHAQLRALYEKAAYFYENKAAKEEYSTLIPQVKQLRSEIDTIYEMWRKEAKNFGAVEEYALWHQQDATLYQLVMDYGSSDYIYFVPPEIGSVRLNLQSSLPIPRESWAECLELILAQYGVGIKNLNPYLRELYFYQNDLSWVKMITEKVEDLDLLPKSARVCFILTPKSTDPRSSLALLQRFSNHATTQIDMIAGKIFLTGPAGATLELMKLYSFAKAGDGTEEFQVVTLNKVDAKEMQTILKSAFFGSGSNHEEEQTLKVIPLESLSSSLFISGTKDEVSKALKLISEIETTIEDPQEKTVFWYTAKHSDAEELATVLAKVYDLLTNGAPVAKSAAKGEGEQKKKEGEKNEDHLLVKIPTIEPGKGANSHHYKTADGQNNFVVDPKTGSIIMVVKQEALGKIKELLKKLDVPKKMVQIEVLLFEKKMNNNNNFGLNLLRMGSAALNTHATGLLFGGGPAGSVGASIMDFFISRTKTGSGIPAYDAAYQFLIGQEDIQINASPSVTTMNQTPAKIAIVEEISIDSGSNEKNAARYNRAQYGIVMEIVPTINMEEGEEGCCITLDTDITFDTTKKNALERPDVTRRHIKNHVRIKDGETVILGGLRRKSTEDTKDSIPFLGEIPGLGKLFSSSKMNDSSTEMFVFITPKILDDPAAEAERAKREELQRRPGDLPEYMQQLIDAKAREKRRFFEGTLTMLFGRGDAGEANGSTLPGEYDGRS